MANIALDALLDTVQTKISGLSTDQAKVELYNTAIEVCQEVLRIVPGGDINSDPEGWLPPNAWARHYQTLLEGTLMRLYAQTGRPYFSGELAQAHGNRYNELLKLSRSDASDDPNSVYTRLLSNLRTQLPMARDSTLKLEIYNTADKIRREALNLPPLNGLDTDPNSWLPEDKWDDVYQAMLHGSLSALYNHTNHPWANPQTAETHLGRYVAEIENARAEASGEERANALSRITDLARVHLPGARDTVIQQEFFAAMKEFFITTNVWTEEICMGCGTHGCGGCGNKCVGVDYEIFPTMGMIVRLMQVTDEDCYPVAARMDIPGTVTLYHLPKSKKHFKALVSLTVADPTNREGNPRFPTWVAQKYQNVLLDGLLYRMMLQPAKPYSNPQLAEYHGKRFRAGMSKASTEKLHGHVFRGQNWRFPQTFRTSSQRH
jgi:hypothetical protein